MRCAVLAGVVVGLMATTALAERWTAKAKIEIGPCSDGLMVTVTESPGMMNLKFSFEGKDRGIPREIKLAPDGSGKADFTGADGPVAFTVSPGTGKRVMSASQKEGRCRWSFH
jgi:hypothetical protein